MKKYVAIYMVPQRVNIEAPDMTEAESIARESATKGDILEGFGCKLMQVEPDDEVRQIVIPPELPMPPMAA